MCILEMPSSSSTVPEIVPVLRRALPSVVMLLSFINLKLRDYYKSLEALCDDLNADRAELEEKLAGIDYHYDEGKNQFV